MNDQEQGVVPDDVPVQPEPKAKTDYIEFVGMAPYGTEFYKGEHGSHTVSKAHLKQYHDVTTPKDLVWTKGANGRMLLKTEDMSPEAAEVLVNDPMFKAVSL